jgi:hypothetical protein
MEFLLLVIPVISKGTIVLPTRLEKSPEGPRESIVPTGTPNRPQMFLFGPRKGVEVPDLNAPKLCKTWGFSGQSHIKSVFLGPNKKTCGWFGGNMGTINTTTQSGGSG